MWTGRPVSVERISRCVKDRWPVNLRNSGVEFDILAGYRGIVMEFAASQNRSDKNYLSATVKVVCSTNQASGVAHPARLVADLYAYR